MGQDIRELFQNENNHDVPALEANHQKRFERRLEAALPEQKQQYMWYKMAAVFVVALGTGLLFYLNGSQGETENRIADTPAQVEQEVSGEKRFSLSDISPEYKRVEDYYMASINVEISKLNVTPANKELIDSFMEQLAGLDEEYQNLNAELEETGINETTIEALIDNLKLRLELLVKLKQKLKDINNIDHEKYQSNSI